MLAVLISGGLDSAILLGDALRQQLTVQPIFIRCGLHWEAVELSYLRRYLEALAGPSLRPLVILDEPIADVYGTHWSTTGQGVPAADSPDSAVYLPGRNLLLFGKAMLWCHLHGVAAISAGLLSTNPFPDATSEFLRAMEDLVHRATGSEVRILRWFEGKTKADVMKLGVGLPLQHSFSCIRPLGGLHCGRCNKCAERRQAFSNSSLLDPTQYASPCAS